MGNRKHTASSVKTQPTDNGDTAHVNDSRQTVPDALFSPEPAAADRGTAHPQETATPQATPHQNPPPAPEAQFDPYDPESYKTGQNMAAATGVREVIVELPVCKPMAHWWVRRHPDPTYVFDTWVIDIRDIEGVYMAVKPLWPRLVGTPGFRRVHLYLATTMQGKAFVWPVRVPADDTKPPDKWMRMPLAAIAQAKDVWTQIAWDEGQRQHRLHSSDRTDSPQFPDLTPRRVLELAFKNYTIDNWNHPILRQIRGEAQK
jgi:hypothetical protein